MTDDDATFEPTGTSMELLRLNARTVVMEGMLRALFISAAPETQQLLLQGLRTMAQVADKYNAKAGAATNVEELSHRINTEARALLHDLESKDPLARPM